ncbi:MAG TPA: MoaD/ThiS family protein [Syntrophobacteria bacterium]|nr:MoaD/ThiS family protein [Syntrophobacteria bacterium]
MEVEVKLFATLRRRNFQQGKVILREEPTPLDLLARLEVPASEVAVVLVNGRHARLDDRLHQGDTVAFFPAIAGG